MKEQENKNYNLQSDAVEALAGADESNTPEYSQEELKKYRSRSGIKVPKLLKILAIKAWFFGAVCYFVLWGLGMYIPNLIDMMFVLGVVLGMVTDLLTNNVIRFIEAVPGENDEWLLFPQKGMVGFGLHLLYGLVLMLGVFTLYDMVNVAINAITGQTDVVPLGVEPILFGIFCLGFDLLLIGIKRLLRRILADAKASARQNNC